MSKNLNSLVSLLSAVDEGRIREKKVKYLLSYNGSVEVLTPPDLIVKAVGYSHSSLWKKNIAAPIKLAVSTFWLYFATRITVPVSPKL